MVKTGMIEKRGFSLPAARRLPAVPLTAVLFLAALLPRRPAPLSAQNLEAPVFAAWNQISSAPYPPSSPASPEGRPLRARRQSGDPSPLTGSAALTISREAGKQGLTIPGLDQPLTQRYIAQYSSPAGLRRLVQIMKNAAPWLPFIREEIARRGLPPELLYLPVIESSYLPTALSRSGAAGIWQFMRNSIGPFDMRISYWVDERFDFWKSTLGALGKLEDNYRQMEDWTLALAAYNMGMGGLRRVIRQAGVSDYWTLAERKFLSTENTHYIPKFLAVAWILSNPRRFGLDLDWSGDPQWVRISAGRHIDLERLAAAANIDPAMLRAANAECVHGITPADSWYFLKIPAASADLVESLLADASVSPVFPRIHIVQRGETLWGIGRRYRISPDILAETNGMKSTDILREGRRLNIPIME